MTLAEFLLLVPFDEQSVFHHFTVQYSTVHYSTLELLIYCFH